MGTPSSKVDINRRVNSGLVRSVTVVLFAISILLLTLSILILSINPGWLQFGLLLVSATIFLASILAILYYRNGRTKPVLWVALFSVIFVVLVHPLLISGMSLVIGLVCFIIVFFVYKNYMVENQLKVFLVIGLIILLGTYLLDNFGTNDRLNFLPPSISLYLIIFLAILNVYVVISHLSTFSLRVRISGTLVMIGILIILFLSWIELEVNRRTLLEFEGQSLANAADQVSRYLDQAMKNLEDINHVLSAQALIVDVYPASSQNNLAVQAKDLMNGYLNSNQNIFSDYLLGYILFDPAENIIFAEPDTIPDEIDEIVNWYLANRDSQDISISPLLFDENDEPYLLVTTNIYSAPQEIKGYLVSVYNGFLLQRLVHEMNDLTGEQSFALLVDENGLRLAQGLITDNIFIIYEKQDEINFTQMLQSYRLPPTSSASKIRSVTGIKRLLEDEISELASPVNYIDNSLGLDLEYTAVKTEMNQKPWAVIYAEPLELLNKPFISNLNQIIILAFIVLVLLVFIAFTLTRVFISPIHSLTKMVEALEQGDYSIYMPVRSQDEIGQLTNAMNSLAVHLKQTLKGMDEGIRGQTSEFERRTRQLQLAADVGRAAVTIHNQEDLLSRVVEIISEQFTFYHVGIYIIDESGEHAVLKAASSEGGKRMIAVNHKLAIGYQGLVGYVAATGQSKIALDVGEDAEYFNNPELPHTRSELALPLISSRELLGVLDIHSVKPSAFTPNDFTAMQVLANLIAVALDNARLFAESRNAVEATRRAYGEISRNAWLEHLVGRNSLMIRSQSRGTYEINTKDGSESHSELPQLISIPIMVRDQVIGYVDTYKPLEEGYWTSNEEEMLGVLADQVGIALESARLFESTKALAERERLIAEVSSRLQENLDVETVIKVAVQIFRQALDLQDVTIILQEDRYGSSG